MSEQIIRIGNIGNGDGLMNAAAFQAQLDLCDPQKDLYLDFNSQGGEVMEGFAIFNAIKDWPSKTVARIKSAAFSIASYLAMACDEIQIAENGYFMIHNPYSGFEGDDEAFANHSQFLRDLKESMIDAYSNRTAIGIEEVARMMKRETFITANKAVEIGFADKIIDAVKAENVFSEFKLPQPVFASLFGSKVVGNEPSKLKDNPMSEEQKPVAATIKAIKAAFPKASSDFLVRCMEEEMTMEEVTEEMYEALAMENEELKAKVKAMEDEKMASAQAMEDEAVAMEDEEETVEPPSARRKGVAPVARASSNSKHANPKAEWLKAVDSFKGRGMNPQQAAIAANKANPGLREAMVAAANA